MKALLVVAGSTLWSSASALARALSNVGVLKSTRLEAGKTIGVGNLQAGGAGKTPLVAEIARQAHDRGLSVCILSRGYRSEWENHGGVIPPGEARVDTGLCGDEAALLHELVPQAFISVGADRAAQYRKAVESHGRPFDVVILDDAFQHWKIEQDVRVVALTSSTRGERIFRDFQSALARADLVVWTKGDRAPESIGRPWAKVRFEIPKGSERLWLVTGLGDGLSVRDSLAKEGYSIDKHLQFPDHARYEEGVAKAILKSAREAGCRVALTGKDWVKWRELGILESQVLRLEPRVVFMEGRDVWDRALWASSSSRS